MKVVIVLNNVLELFKKKKQSIRVNQQSKRTKKINNLKYKIKLHQSKVEFERIQKFINLK